MLPEQLSMQTLLICLVLAACLNFDPSPRHLRASLLLLQNKDEQICELGPA